MKIIFILLETWTLNYHFSHCASHLDRDFLATLQNSKVQINHNHPNQFTIGKSNKYCNPIISKVTDVVYLPEINQATPPDAKYYHLIHLSFPYLIHLISSTTITSQQRDKNALFQCSCITVYFVNVVWFFWTHHLFWNFSGMWIWVLSA